MDEVKPPMIKFASISVDFDFKPFNKAFERDLKMVSHFFLLPSSLELVNPDLAKDVLSIGCRLSSKQIETRTFCWSLSVFTAQVSL